MRRHGSVGCSAGAICCSAEDVAEEDEDVEEDVDVGEETDSALSCLFWHFSTDDTFKREA